MNDNKLDPVMAAALAVAAVPEGFIKEFMAHRHFWAAKDIDIVARKDGREYRLEGDWLKEFVKIVDNRLVPVDHQ